MSQPPQEAHIPPPELQAQSKPQTSNTPTYQSNPSGKFTLLLLGPLSSHTNTESLTLSAPTTLSNLIMYLETQYPGTIKILRCSSFVRDLEYLNVDLDELCQRVMRRMKRQKGGEAGEQGEVDGDVDREVWIRNGEEVGFVPPVSSG